jgi:hypothetical protein
LQRVLAIAHVLGGLLMVMAATYLLPIAWSVAVDDGTTDSFIRAAVGTASAGLALWAPTRRFKRELQPRDGCLLVVLAWVSMAAAATVPFLLEIPGISFTDAYFESMSGLTTTGATVASLQSSDADGLEAPARQLLIAPRENRLLAADGARLATCRDRGRHRSEGPGHHHGPRPRTGRGQARPSVRRTASARRGLISRRAPTASRRRGHGRRPRM